MADAELRVLLYRFEEALAARDPAGVEGGLASLLADDFLEFGRSGRVWAKQSMLGPLLAGPGAPVPLERFEVAELAPGVALVTYHAAMANRSSVWVRRDGRWQLPFHQGTETAGDAGGTEGSTR